MIVVRRRRAFDGKPMKLVLANDRSGLGFKEIQGRGVRECPLPVVSKRTGRVRIGADQIMVLALDGTVARMKFGQHLVHR